MSGSRAYNGFRGDMKVELLSDSDLEVAKSSSSSWSNSRTLRYGVILVVLLVLVGLAILIPILVFSVSNDGDVCSAKAVKVSFMAPAAGDPATNRYTVAQVQDHMDALELREWPYGHIDSLQLGCVDARFSHEIAGVPGGDMGVWMAAVFTYLSSHPEVPTTVDSIYKLFQKFIEESGHVTEVHPFYYHTDDSKLDKLFAAVSTAAGIETPTIFPTAQPTANADVWYNLFPKSEYQGCGHIRLSLEDPARYGYTYPADNPSLIPENTLKAFLRYFWTGKHHNRIEFVVKLGPLEGRAVAVVVNQGPECTNQVPLVWPNHYGSSIFVYTPQAAAAFQEKILGPFFSDVDPKLNQTQFVRDLDRLSQLQLQQTIGPQGLAPANQVDVFQVNFTTSD